MKILLSLSLISVLALTSLNADDLDGFDALEGFDMQEESQEDIDLDDFGEDEISESEVVTLQQTPSNFSFNGNLAFKSAYGYQEHSVDGVEYSGFNQAQTALFLQVNYKINSDWKVRVSGDGFYDGIYDLHDKAYNQATLDAYQTQLRFDDTYIQGRITKDIDLKLGRQIVVWGKSDSIRITDVINPLDNRLPGMTDIEDLRLSTSMLKLDYYVGSWNLSAMAIFESRIFLEAAPFGEYFPADIVFPGAPNPFIPLAQPTSTIDDTQYAFALNGVFSGWDLSFYGADVLDSRWHLEGTPVNGERVVSKIQMLGSAFNIVKGSWLFKTELAYINGLKYNSTQDEKNRLDTLIGLDYMGVKDTVLSLEVANKHLLNYEKQMSGYTLGIIPDYTEEDEIQTAIRATHSFSNDTINTTALLSMFGHNWQYGGFARVSLEYDIADALVANFGLINYIAPAKPEDKPFTDAISNNGRVFADITYSF
ncbi:MAG TPA: DUF1302 domain-containing protein [Sulfurimonas sp.]|nr:DUF1302 domain-containing protein [Sulfurimonas sp.]